MSVYVKIEEAAAIIGLSASTVKKYYLMVEEKGYRFLRNKQGQLMFSEQDMEMFKKIIVMKNKPGMSVQKAVDLVVGDITSITVYDEDKISAPQVNLEFMKEFIEAQTEVNKELMKELKDTKDYIAARLDKRDEALMISLRETQEVKALLKEAKEEGSKRWWTRIFKKS